MLNYWLSYKLLNILRRYLLICLNFCFIIIFLEILFFQKFILIFGGNEESFFWRFWLINFCFMKNFFIIMIIKLEILILMDNIWAIVPWIVIFIFFCIFEIKYHKLFRFIVRFLIIFTRYKEEGIRFLYTVIFKSYWPSLYLLLAFIFIIIIKIIKIILF